LSNILCLFCNTINFVLLGVLLGFPCSLFGSLFLFTLSFLSQLGSDHRTRASFLSFFALTLSLRCRFFSFSLNATFSSSFLGSGFSSFFLLLILDLLELTFGEFLLGHFALH
jgi:hypothetical protein